jgi:hypothetical protein
MTSIHTNVFPLDVLDQLQRLPEVLAAKARLETRSHGMVYFTIPMTDALRTTLHATFGLDLSAAHSIPMRWIKGDTAPHVDVTTQAFEYTHLLYLNDSPGELVVGDESYPIRSNTAFVFHEGISHETRHTEYTSRLLIGPMSEQALPVGSNVSYYPSEPDALAYSNSFGSSNSFIVGDGGPFGGFTSWRIAPNSSGSSPQNVVYANGSTLIEDGSYYLYPAAPCFLEGSTILCQVDGVEQYVPVEELRNGTLVKTSLHGYKKVVAVGKGSIQNPGDDARIENRLYRCSPSHYPALKQDLYLTGCHSILEFPITDKQKENTIAHLGKLFVTDNKYRLMACVDERAEPWNSEGEYPIYHFALENEDDGMNYGVYANGLLVETCAIRTLLQRSNMKLL